MGREKPTITQSQMDESLNKLQRTYMDHSESQRKGIAELRSVLNYLLELEPNLSKYLVGEDYDYGFDGSRIVRWDVEKMKRVVEYRRVRMDSMKYATAPGVE